LSRADGRTGGQADSSILAIGQADHEHLAGQLSVRPAVRLSACNRCGHPVASRAWGCKNPCANCGTVYPLGDCSD